MKFRMNFGIVKTVIVAVIIVGALAIAALDIAMLAGANGVATQQPAVAWVSIVAAVIIAVAALLVLFNSYYGFKEDKMVSVLGFSLTNQVRRYRLHKAKQPYRRDLSHHKGT